MNIPNDFGHPYRLDKFVDYQHFAPSIDPVTYTEYARRRQLTEDEAIVLAWYHSVTYCEITAGLLLEELPYKRIQPYTVEKYWEENKSRLIFGSARRYAKNMDWFYPLMDQFMREIRRQPSEWLNRVAGVNEPNSTPTSRYNRIYKELSKWKFMGRFSIDLFLEAIISLSKEGFIDIDLEIPGWDWKSCSNLTSGLYNIFYMDKEADEYDKTGYIQDTKVLDGFIKEVVTAVNNKYPEQRASTPAMVNKICSFRNLFKGHRYGGFHHDRQLGNLLEYKKSYADKVELWNDFFDIRRDLFPDHMLGEVGGWTGIRTERKKIWLREGLTGVEIASKY